MGFLFMCVPLVFCLYVWVAGCFSVSSYPGSQLSPYLPSPVSFGLLLLEAVSSISFLVRSLGTPLSLALTDSVGSVPLRIPGSGQRDTLVLCEPCLWGLV